MAQVKLVQEGREVSIMVKNLINSSGTNLTKVCDKHEINYADTYKTLHAKSIDVEWLMDLIRKINPDAVVELDFSIRIEIDGKEVFTQKIKSDERENALASESE